MEKRNALAAAASVAVVSIFGVTALGAAAGGIDLPGGGASTAASGTATEPAAPRIVTLARDEVVTAPASATAGSTEPGSSSRHRSGRDDHHDDRAERDRLRAAEERAEEREEEAEEREEERAERAEDAREDRHDD